MTRTARALFGCLCLTVLGCLSLASFGCQRRAVQTGSKVFTESVVLGEIATQACAADTRGTVTHRAQLGGTMVLWKALLAGEIDAYPEYTGTIAAELVPGTRADDRAALQRALAEQGVRMTAPLGFSDTYAIGVTPAVSDARGLRTLSDLVRQPDLVLGLSHEFLERADGWPGLKRHYGLPQTDVRGLDHDLAYRALASGTIHATDLYTTDAEIAFYGLRVLEDDRRYFPAYEAVIIYRADLAEHAPACARALDALEGRIDAPAMIAMNAAVKIERKTERVVAADFLGRAAPGRDAEGGLAGRLFARTREHLALVIPSLLLAVIAAVPLGIVAARRRWLGALVLGASGVLQTIPSLALLVALIPLFGIGARPAIAALFLYSLLPVAQGTVTGLRGIAKGLQESAEALGLSPRDRLLRVELPLALPSILAGIRTAAVIDVGTATLGALVGAGGYGQTILAGVRLAAPDLLLEGAVPAAALALAVQASLGALERAMDPAKGARGQDIPRG